LRTCEYTGTTAKAQVSAQYLYSYSFNNEVNFNSTYTGKTVKVKGVVTSNVFQNTGQWTSGYSLWLGWQNDGYYHYAHSLTGGVRLFFTESNARQFANIRQGDVITIQGRCIGRGGSLIYTYKFGRPTEVFVDNCTLIQFNESNADRVRRSELLNEEEDKRSAEREAERRRREALEKEQEAERRKQAEKERARREQRAHQQRVASSPQRAQWEREQQQLQQERERHAGLSWSVTSSDLRFAGSKPLPSYTPNETSVRIAVKVTVDRDGDATEATIDVRRSTIYDSSVLDAALDAALSTKFAARKSRGTLLYLYGSSSQ
jgi:hypothetical protein